MALDADGFKAIKVWGCDLYENIWVLGYKQSNSEDIYKTFCLGNDYDMVGGGDSSGAPKWRTPKIENETYTHMKEIASSGMYALGIDNKDRLWEWGSHK